MTRTTTLGMGKKAIQTLSQLRNDRYNPAPNRYNIASQFKKKGPNSKGKTFGISYKYYDKVYVPNQILKS